MSQTIISNKEGKRFALFMIIGMVVSALLVIKYRGLENSIELLILFGILVLIFIFFTFKSLLLENGELIVFYPLRPILRTIRLDSRKIKKIKYRLRSGGSHYRNLQIFSKSPPWIVEFRLKRDFDIDQFIEIYYQAGKLQLEHDRKNHILVPKA